MHSKDYSFFSEAQEDPKVSAAKLALFDQLRELTTKTLKQTQDNLMRYLKSHTTLHQRYLTPTGLALPLATDTVSISLVVQKIQHDIAPFPELDQSPENNPPLSEHQQKILAQKTKRYRLLIALKEQLDLNTNIKNKTKQFLQILSSKQAKVLRTNADTFGERALDIVRKILALMTFGLSGTWRSTSAKYAKKSQKIAGKILDRPQDANTHWKPYYTSTPRL